MNDSIDLVDDHHQQRSHRVRNLNVDSYESQVKESAPSLFRSKERFKATINDRYKETTDT